MNTSHVHVRNLTLTRTPVKIKFSLWHSGAAKKRFLVSWLEKNDLFKLPARVHLVTGNLPVTSYRYWLPVRATLSSLYTCHICFDTCGFQAGLLPDINYDGVQPSLHHVEAFLMASVGMLAHSADRRSGCQGPTQTLVPLVPGHTAEGYKQVV